MQWDLTISFKAQTVPIQDEGNNIIAQACYQIAKEFDIEPYDEHTGKGVLRHIIGRIGQSGWMIILVTATEFLTA